MITSTKTCAPKLVITTRNTNISSALQPLFNKFPTRAPSNIDSREMNDYTDLLACLPLPVIRSTVQIFLAAQPPMYGRVCPTSTRFIHRAVRHIIWPAMHSWVKQWDGETTIPDFIQEVVTNIRSLNQTIGTTPGAKLS